MVTHKDEGHGSLVVEALVQGCALHLTHTLGYITADVDTPPDTSSDTLKTVLVMNTVSYALRNKSAAYSPSMQSNLTHGLTTLCGTVSLAVEAEP
jgi:hypothetical protein